MRGVDVAVIGGGAVGVCSALELARQGASVALDSGVPPVQAVVLGAITGIGGGMVRDILVNEIPEVLRGGLYAVPALLGAGVVVAAAEADSQSTAFPLIGMALCFAVRVVALRRDVNLPSR